MKKKEIKRLIGKTQEKGYSLIPLKVYFAGGWAKVDLALAKGKRKVDKRRAIREKDLKKEIPKLLLQGLSRSPINGIQDFIGLVDQVGLKVLLGLLLVPGASPWSPQVLDDVKKTF